MKKSVFLLAVCALFLVFSLFARGTGTLVGHVVGEDGDGLFFANVVLGKIGRGDLTDETGYFVIRDIPRGHYRVSVARRDFYDSAYEVPILEDETTTAYFTLERPKPRVAQAGMAVYDYVCDSFQGEQAITATGRLGGRVVNDKGEPIAKAVISLQGTELKAETDERGRYLVAVIPAGGFTVKAEAIGYRSVLVENVRVKVDETRTLKFTMQASEESESPQGSCCSP
jgi:hypothetical protein